MMRKSRCEKETRVHVMPDAHDARASPRAARPAGCAPPRKRWGYPGLGRARAEVEAVRPLGRRRRRRRRRAVLSRSAEEWRPRSPAAPGAGAGAGAGTPRVGGACAARRRPLAPVLLLKDVEALGAEALVGRVKAFEPCSARRSARGHRPGGSAMRAGSQMRKEWSGRGGGGAYALPPRRRGGRRATCPGAPSAPCGGTPGEPRRGPPPARSQAPSTDPAPACSRALRRLPPPARSSGRATAPAPPGSVARAPPSRQACDLRGFARSAAHGRCTPGGSSVGELAQHSPDPSARGRRRRSPGSPSGIDLGDRGSPQGQCGLISGSASSGRNAGACARGGISTRRAGR
jgi:hypothetical protein